MFRTQDYFRPFELLKLIRDKRITNIRQFFNVFNFLPISYLFKRTQLNDENEIVSTNKLARLFNIIGVSLTQLSNFSDSSVVCSPLFGAPTEPVVKSDIFVVMPFLKSLQPVYDDHIRSVAKKMNLTIARGDDFFTARSIISDIWNALNACNIIVADCTGRNPNVFYEIGMAHTLGKPVILISQSKDDIPFDIQHIRYLVYEFTPRGMLEFEEKLQSTISSELGQIFSYEMLLDKK